MGSNKKIYPFHTPFLFLILKEDSLMVKKIHRFIYIFLLNSLSASLLLNIFLSFEVGIAHAIANFK